MNRHPSTPLIIAPEDSGHIANILDTCILVLSII
jgi:hypothetical protein